MSDKKPNLGIWTEVFDILQNTVLSEEGQKKIFGTYSDGKARSFVDAYRDEVISPKDRVRWEKKKQKKKKKGKSKKETEFWRF